MSELAKDTGDITKVRHQLLATVSVISLLGAACLSTAQAQSDEDRPTVWIELGGQLERTDGGAQRFAPPFVSMFDPADFENPTNIQRQARYSIGEEIKLSVTPDQSNWVLSASVHYGRANRSSQTHHELGYATAIQHATVLGVISTQVVTGRAKNFDDATFKTNESHAVIDFQAGKDVGLGLFGKGTSVLSGGIRFAQFQSSTTATISGVPDQGFSYNYITHLGKYQVYIKRPVEHWHLYAANAEMKHNFRGIGPSLEWDASVPVLGRPESLQVNFDWGVNGAVLFGRQKVKGHHETKADYRPTDFTTVGDVTALVPVYHHPYDIDRSRSVIVPNIGGLAGLSFNYANAKLKFGYRADFFFGAMDGGIDTRKTYDRNFYGPFATISIGLGG